MTFSDELLKQELRELWQQLENEPEFHGKLAGPFFGYAPKTFSSADVKILYIGKATKGPFVEPNASELAFGCNSGMFWSFACRLGSKTGDSHSPLANIAWSNLCRIGFIDGNPSQALAERQRDLAVRTIKAEIAFLEPSLIVCVASDSPYDDFLYEVLDTKRGEDLFVTKREGEMTLYSQPGLDGYPPVLWMRHPERKSNAYLSFAKDEAMRLLGIG